MDKERLIQLLQFVLSTDQNLINLASDELLKFYSTPESLILLSIIYNEIQANNSLKQLIIIGINHSLKMGNLSKLTNEQLIQYENLLVFMISNETNNRNLKDISELFRSVLSYTKQSWPSLDTFLINNSSNSNEYFNLFNQMISETKTPEECIKIIEFIRPKIHDVFEIDSPISTQFSALCMIATIAIQKENPEFLFEFVDIFKIFFQKVCNSENFNDLNSFLKIISYCNFGLNSANFSDLVCPLNLIFEFCLIPETPFIKCIYLRDFLKGNMNFYQNNLDLDHLKYILCFLIQLSMKLYSTEPDVQTQQLDDYFSFLKYLSIPQCQEFCSSQIFKLLQEETLPSVCTAISLLRGAITRGVIFNDIIHFFLTIYSINNSNIRILALSALCDVSDEISFQIEEGADALLQTFIEHMKVLVLEDPITREQSIKSIYEALNYIFLICFNFDSNLIEELYRILFNIIHNGSLNEQFLSILLLSQCIRKNSNVAKDPNTLEIILQLLESNDPEFKNLSISILQIYLHYYSEIIIPHLDKIFKIIDNTNSQSCYGYMCSFIGNSALAFGEQVRDSILKKLPFISMVCHSTNIDDLQSNAIEMGIESLFYVMLAYNDTIPTLFPQAITAIVNAILNCRISNSRFISKGIDAFYMSGAKINSQNITPVINAVLNIYNDTDKNISDEYFDIINSLIVISKEIPQLDHSLFIAVKRFLELIESDDKKDVRGIELTSDFIRTVIEMHKASNLKHSENSTSQVIMNSLSNIRKICSQLVTVCFSKLSSRKFSPVVESHLLLIIAAIAIFDISCFPNDYEESIQILFVKLLQDSIPNTIKNIAYVIKVIVEEKPQLLSSSIHLYFETLQSKLSLNPKLTFEIARLNEYILSALLTIESKFFIIPVNDFFSLVCDFLPLFTDEEEAPSIYSFMLSFFKDMDQANKDKFVASCILFLSMNEYNQICQSIFKQDIIIQMLNHIKIKLDTVENPQEFISHILPNSSAQQMFIQNYNSSFRFFEHNEINS